MRNRVIDREIKNVKPFEREILVDTTVAEFHQVGTCHRDALQGFEPIKSEFPGAIDRCIVEITDKTFESRLIQECKFLGAEACG